MAESAQPMKFSLITACFNSAATIRDTIDSVVAQTHPDIEYIVIDGASQDRTLEIVREYGGRVSKLVSEADGGIYNAMNKGVRLATGDVIGTINSDDFYAGPEVISGVARAFEDTGADCVFGDLEYVHPLRPAKVLRRWRSQPYRAGAFQRGWHPAHPTFFARRELYQRLGGFDESLRISSDFELMLRFLEAGKASSAHLPDVLVRMRDGGVSNRSLANILRANIECYRSFAMNGLHASPLVMLRKPLSKLAQIKAARFA
jgi:glycosyltransferase involved in cell wall biosynthesis